MIRHIVMWSIAATEPEVRAADIATITEALNGLASEIPVVRSLSVLTNDVAVDGNFDVAIVLDVDSVGDLDAYQVHPAHQAVLPIIRSRVSARAALDAEI